MAPKLSILIVSYNTRDMTIACLDSILAATSDTTYEVIVVDNASTDGSAAAVAAHPIGARLIASGENLGFAEGNNRAANLARGELLLLINPDTVVVDRAIDRLVAFAEQRPDAKIWGGRTIFADGRLNPANAWGRITVWRLACRAVGLTGVFPNSAIFNGEAIGGWDRESERRVDIVSGCFLLITREFWRRLGGFDPVFFMYGEEADLCLRAKALGAKPAIGPTATIIHHGGASEATREGKLVKLLAAKSELIIRHVPLWQQALALTLNAAWPLTRWLALESGARLRSRSDHRERAAVWRSVWRRRDEWQQGWGSGRAAPAIGSAVGKRRTNTATEKAI